MTCFRKFIAVTCFWQVDCNSDVDDENNKDSSFTDENIMKNNNVADDAFIVTDLTFDVNANAFDSAEDIFEWAKGYLEVPAETIVVAGDSFWLADSTSKFADDNFEIGDEALEVTDDAFEVADPLHFAPDALRLADAASNVSDDVFKVPDDTTDWVGMLKTVASKETTRQRARVVVRAWLVGSCIEGRELHRSRWQKHSSPSPGLDSRMQTRATEMRR